MGADEKATPPADTTAPVPDGAPEPVAIPDGHVEVVVVTPISGTRDGVPWPAPGEPLVLPEVEAAGYLQFGYVRLPDTE